MTLREIPKNWKSAELGDLSEITSSKRIYRSEYVNNGIPFYRSKEIIEHYNHKPVSTELYITENKYEEIKSKFGIPQKGDILITSVGSLGIPYLVSGNFDFYFKDGNLIWFRKFSKEIDSKFFYFWIQSHEGKARFRQSQIGTSQPAYTIANIKKLKIPLPPLATQKRIAEILGQYDDLIENNNRRIALLEQAAKHLYKEWFVRFKFPGHEKVKIVDGLPKGWEKKTIEKILSNHIGGGWGQEEYTSKEAIPAYVIRGTDIPNILSGNTSTTSLRFHKESNFKSRKLIPSDIVFEVSGGSVTQPVGRTMLITSQALNLFDENVICASFCKRLSFPNLSISYYINEKIKDDRNNGHLQVFQKQAAAAIQNFNFDAFLSHYEVIIPPKTILNLFTEIVEYLYSQQYNLCKENQNLKKARDLLLPRFMRGELIV